MTRSMKLLLLIAASLSLGACETVSDRAGSLWPFGDDEESNQGDAPEDEERVTILALDERLQLDPEQSGRTISLPSPYVNDAWPMAGGYAAHAVQHPSVSGLSERWRRNIGEGSGRQGALSAQPVTAGGLIYTMDSRNRVTAMDASTGANRWDITLRSDNRRDKISFGGGLAVGEGRVYATSGLGLIVAFDALTGSEIWRRETTAPVQSAPAVANGRVFAVTDDNELYAVDSATGDLLWTYQAIVESARIMSAAAPAIFNDIVVAPFASGEVVALRAANGRPIWQDALTRAGQLAAISLLNDIASPPVIFDGAVYAISHSGVLAAIDLQTGERIWSQPAGGVNMPWVVGDVIYVMTSDGELAALNRADGGVIWLKELPAFKNANRRKNRISWSGPILADGQLILASSEGDGLIVDALTGDTRGEFNPRGEVFVSPIIANETVYLLNDDGQLIAYR